MGNFFFTSAFDFCATISNTRRTLKRTKSLKPLRPNGLSHCSPCAACSHNFRTPAAFRPDLPKIRLYGKICMWKNLWKTSHEKPDLNKMWKTLWKTHHGQILRKSRFSQLFGQLCLYLYPCVRHPASVFPLYLPG